MASCIGGVHGSISGFKKYADAMDIVMAIPTLFLTGQCRRLERSLNS